MKNIFSNFDYSDFKKSTFPKPGSDEFDHEMKVFEYLPEDDSFVLEMDDITSRYKDLFENNKLEFPSKTVDKLVSDSRMIIKDLKNFHDRARPWNFISDKSSVNKLDSMETPSFPSGHSTQSELLSLFLSDYYPNLGSELKKLSSDISISRNLARAHYISDSVEGIKLGKSMYNFLKQS